MSAESELYILRARQRHGGTIICDRCGDSITLSYATERNLEPYLLRVALETGWQVTHATAKECSGGFVIPDSDDRDLCPHCRTVTGAVPPKSR